MRGLITAAAAALGAAILVRRWVRSDTDRIVTAVVLGAARRLRDEHREIMDELEGR